MKETVQELAKAHDAKLALFEAFFTRRKNVSKTQVLADVAAEIGLDRDAALAMLESGEDADSVARKKLGKWRQQRYNSVTIVSGRGSISVS